MTRIALYNCLILLVITQTGCEHFKQNMIASSIEESQRDQLAWLYFHPDTPAADLLATLRDSGVTDVDFVKNSVEAILMGAAFSGQGGDYDQLLMIARSIYNPAMTGKQNLQAVVDSPALQQFVRTRLVKQAPFNELNEEEMDLVIRAAVKYYTAEIDAEDEAWAQGRINIVLPFIQE